MAKEKYLLIGILLLGLVLRLINLGQSFWLDEASQAQMSALSISQIWFERREIFTLPCFIFIPLLDASEPV